MNNKYRYIFITGLMLLAMLILGGPLLAQSMYQQRINPCPVMDGNGDLYRMPFTGGLNRPIHQFLDIDDDNDQDLVLLDQTGRLSVYQNNGTPFEHHFEWIENPFGDLQLGDWFKFVDADRDGDMDLFVENPYSIIRYYRNDGNRQQANYVLAADTLYDVAGAMLFTDGFSIPAWADTDSDGDAELFLGRQSGTIAQYRLSHFTNNDVPVYQLVTDSFEELIILTGGKRKSHSDKGNTRHGANSLAFVDIDGDEDVDCFWGDFYAPSMVFMENTGTPQVPEFKMANTRDEYPPRNPISTGGFNVASFTDIDSDGDVDMFVGVYGGAYSFIRDAQANFYFYENVGSATAPDFALRTRTFIPTLDVGTDSKPTLVDIDSDGDLDIVTANREDLAAPNQQNSRLYLFRNIGDAANPDFKLANTHLLGEDIEGDLSLAPAFTDIDKDGRPDLFLGNWQGTIIYYRNVGTRENAVFERITDTYQNIDVGNFSTPAFADIDNDGDSDLFIGGFAGVIHFYENTGTPVDAQFELRDEHFADVTVFKYSTPSLADINGDGDLDLFVGSQHDGIVLYRNTGSSTNPHFVADLSFPTGIGHRMSTPAAADLDYDGKLDIISGSASGGVLFYEGQISTAAPFAVDTEALDFGEINIGQQGHIDLAITNRTESTISVTAEISADNRQARFSLAAQDLTIAPLATGIIKVYFNPISEVTVAGNLHISANGSVVAVQLIGDGQGDNPLAAFKLYSNYPNPFNQETVIEYEVHVETTEPLNLLIFNMLGQEIRRIPLSNQQNVIHSIRWDGKDNNNQAVSSGLYLYQIDGSGQAAGTQKMLLVR